jgi:cyclophilin family peptidyl-prolyl cis-trans isomerase
MTNNFGRIAKYSWVQCGGFDLQHIHMPCENYAVPHNRRGVLSMCNKRRHEDNSTQFYITLEPASWMDYNYVAFG